MRARSWASAQAPTPRGRPGRARRDDQQIDAGRAGHLEVGATARQVEAGEPRAKRRQQRDHVGHEHRTGAERDHPMPGPFPKAKAPRRAKANRARRRVPGGVLQRLGRNVMQPVLGQSRRDLLALPGAVSRRRRMLELAATAGAEMRAWRRRARRLLVPLDRLCDQVVATPPDDPHAQAIARQGQRHENPGAGPPRPGCRRSSQALRQAAGFPRRS
ncbi:MAG: hypothetical protein ACREIR_20330 [Geminicoccaceae bacterium]